MHGLFFCSCSMKDNEAKGADDARVAAEVRTFYEQHPYPPPVENLDPYRRLWQDPKRRRADYHLYWPVRAYTEDLSILIAGCGTSQAAKHALRWPAARVTGVDFSATSVRSTLELKRKYHLDNLEVHQLPLERVGELKSAFDQIICTGVLHHLADPGAGLRALRSVLNPDGAMHLMIYAPYGRTGIYMLQDFCAKLGIQASDNDIRDLIGALQALPPGHPLETILRVAPDFRNEAALADALLHPCDRAYSVPQLFDFLKDARLHFGRWVRQAPYSSHAGVLAKIPQASRIARLAPEEQYAIAELFRGTMVRHSAIVYRDDQPDARHVEFIGEAWLRHVPIRLSETICVQERLPPGAAGVLINQAHTYRDLYLPISAPEKCLFDAIDGKRSIGDIVERSFQSSPKPPSSVDAARAFFEQLWRYDQIVFDTSASHETLAT